jgi:uncharacterized membrane protein YccC
MTLRERVAAVAGSLQWARGVRAGVAVAAAMVVCHLLGRPMGWAALGGFEAILVDNGGPYRSRLTTICTLLLGGAAACVVASMTASPTALACAAAAAFCFAVTFARVLAQPIASTGVIILVIYFAGLGATDQTWHGSLSNTLDFVLGGAWAAALSLALWPVDPFRPARLGVADCFALLANFTAGLCWTTPHSVEREVMRQRTHALQRAMRLKMEEARVALGATAARSTSRTVRARNLAVLLETADILFAETLRWTELVERAEDPPSRAAMEEAVRWLSGAEQAIARGLERRPHDGAASFAPEGSHSLQYVRGRAALASQLEAGPGAVAEHLGADERDALQNLEIAFEAVRAVWTGIDLRSTRLQPDEVSAARAGERWVERLRSNWTSQSVALRHAGRMALVAGVDVLLTRLAHVSHGSWLAMTSIIVLQPYGSGTLRKSAQRVGGTIAGGVLAAALAAAIHSQAGIIAVITITATMTLATYAVHYGWYAFFLTPTFVLMSLPHLRDWRFAGVRMLTTVIGALVAVLAMRLLWPEQEEARLSELLGRAAEAEAAYVRAVVGFWGAGGEVRSQAERTVLAPARRHAGLRILDAEEALDRLLLEPGLGRRASGNEARSAALTFITYLRRLMRSATMLAATGGPVGANDRLEALAARLDSVASGLSGGGAETPIAAGTLVAEETPVTVGEQQLQRLERQVGVLARSAAILKARG